MDLTFKYTTERIVVLILLLVSCLKDSHSQANAPPIFATGAPTGACVQPRAYIDIATGNTYNCVNSAWQLGGGGSGLPSGGSVGQVVTNTAPATGTWGGAANVLSLTTTGTNAGEWACAQGPDNGAIIINGITNTIQDECPTSVSAAYRTSRPSAAPVNNNSAMLYNNAGLPSTSVFAKMPQIVALTSQYTNSTTGFTNVTGGNNLAFSLEANTTYVGQCVLYYQAASTGGLNIEFTGPASPTGIAYSLIDIGSATTIVNSSVATAFNTSLGAAVTTATTNFPAIVNFTIINGTNAGTLQLLAKSSAAVQLQIQIGSSCQMQ